MILKTPQKVPEYGQRSTSFQGVSKLPELVPKAKNWQKYLKSLILKSDPHLDSKSYKEVTLILAKII